MVQTSIASWLQTRDKATSVPPSPQTLEAKQCDIELQPATDPPTRPISNGTRLAKLPPLPRNVSIEPVTESSINSFRRHVALLLPIPYPEAFYAETLNNSTISALSRVAMWRESGAKHQVNTQAKDAPTQAQLVAGIRCRLLDHTPGDPTEAKPILYISTITTLAPFRRHALASHLLDLVTRTAFHKHGIVAIMAHVWEANEEGMEWYQNRGFRIVSRAEGYYRRLAPQTAAWVVRKDISTLEAIEWEKEIPQNGH